MLKWLFRSYLIIFILNLTDAIFCIIWPIFYGGKHIYPSITDTIQVLISIPWMFSLQVKFNFYFARGLFLMLMTIVLSIYISDTPKKVGLQYEGTIFVGLVTLIIWTIASHLSLSTMSMTSLSSIAPKGNVINLFLVLIYHIPLAIFAVLIYQLVYRYRVIATEVDTLSQLVGS